VKPSPSYSTADPELEEIDALFKRAGLVHSPRGKTGVPTDGSSSPVSRDASASRRKLQEQIAPQDLYRPCPAPRVAANGVHWLPVPGWERQSWLWHGFSTRLGGNSRAYCPEGAPGELNLGFTASDDREIVVRNRQLLAEAISGSPATPLISLRQVHSTLLHTAAAQDAARQQPCKGDGLMTCEPGMLLAVQTADCIPVLVADRKRHAVAAFHAGWRGTVNRIVEAGVGRMRLVFGSRPEDLIAAIGPGIGPCCYAVGEEVMASFESQFAFWQELFFEVYDTDAVRQKYPMLFLTQRAPGHSPIGPKMHLDLVEANRRQLLAAGLNPRAIKLMGGCTHCQPDLFFSHRASQGHAGRMLSVIGIRENADRD